MRPTAENDPTARNKELRELLRYILQKCSPEHLNYVPAELNSPPFLSPALIRHVLHAAQNSCIDCFAPSVDANGVRKGILCEV